MFANFVGMTQSHHDIAVERVNPYSDATDKTSQVRDMFDSIAPSYDLMNRLMSFGLHRRWLKKAIDIVVKDSPAEILDVATGTADVAIAMARRLPEAHITGIDLSQGMIDVGLKKIEAAALSDRITLRRADCLSLPYDDNSFDAITVAYGVRNFERLADGYAEMLRVLRPGGRITVIELSTPQNRLVKPFYNLYTRHIIPLIGRAVSHDLRAYSYLPESIAAVPQRADMTALMQSVGFADATFHTMTFSTCTIYTAIKPA